MSLACIDIENIISLRSCESVSFIIIAKLFNVLCVIYNDNLTLILLCFRLLIR